MATWVPTKTFVDGATLTFTELNAAAGRESDLEWLKDALRAIGVTADSGDQTVHSAVTGARVSGGSQVIRDGTWTEVAFSEQRFARHDGLDIEVLSTIDPPVVNFPAPLDIAGYFFIGAHVEFASNSAGRRGVRIVVSGTVVASKTRNASSQDFGMTIHTFYELAGDNVTLEVYQNSSADVKLTLNSSGNDSPELWLVRMGQ